MSPIRRRSAARFIWRVLATLLLALGAAAPWALRDRAGAAGLSVSGVSWPVTAGAPIDHLFHETNQAPRDTTWLDLVRRQSSPGLIDAVVARLGGFGERDNLDPTSPRMQMGFVMAGTRRGVAIPLARQIVIAPAIARLLGST